MHKLFPSQIEGEQIYMVVREHWVYFAMKAAVWLFFVIVYFFAKFWLPSLVPLLFTDTLSQFMNLILDLYAVLLSLTIFVLWTVYYLNMQIITAMRIVDIDQVGLFSHVASELNVEKIEDVTSEVNGVFGTLFNYGNVHIQTAGSTEHFEFVNVPNPAHIQKTVHDLYEQIRAETLKTGHKSLPELGTKHPHLRTP